MTEVSHFVDGINLTCNVTFDPGTATTFVGGTVKAYAANIATGVIYNGATSIQSAAVITATFAGGALPVGEYLVQLIGTPLGFAPQTIYEDLWQIKKSLGSA